MISKNEDALICDLAETYNIYDYRQLPPTRVAVFSVGLRSDSRIKMQMSGQKVKMETLILSGIVDRLSLILWLQTKDGQKGKNYPEMVTDAFVANKKIEANTTTFATGEDFEKMRNKLINQNKGGG